MAIKNGNHRAMCNLGTYYQLTEINYELMKKYYLMAIEKENIDAMNNLKKFYDKSIKNNIDIYDEYLFKYINIEHEHIQNNLSYHFKFIKKLYNEKIDLMNLHFEYSMEGVGYVDAKNDFIKKLLNNKN